MKQITRKQFIRTSGRVTIGSVLGLGLIQSATIKLRATDGSGGGGSLTGIKFVPNDTTEHCESGPGVEGGSFIDGGDELDSFRTQTVEATEPAGDVHNGDAEVKITRYVASTSDPGVCVPSTRITLVYKFEFKVTKANGNVYTGEFIWKSVAYWACVNGATTKTETITRSDDQLTPGIPNPVHLHKNGNGNAYPDAGPGFTPSWIEVEDGFPPKARINGAGILPAPPPEWEQGQALGYTVSCCIP